HDIRLVLRARLDFEHDFGWTYPLIELPREEAQSTGIDRAPQQVGIDLRHELRRRRRASFLERLKAQTRCLPRSFRSGFYKPTAASGNSIEIGSPVEHAHSRREGIRAQVVVLARVVAKLTNKMD